MGYIITFFCALSQGGAPNVTLCTKFKIITPEYVGRLGVPGATMCPPAQAGKKKTMIQKVTAPTTIFIVIATNNHEQNQQHNIYLTNQVDRLNDLQLQ